MQRPALQAVLLARRIAWRRWAQVHGDDDVGYGNIACLMGQRVAAAGATRGLHQFVTTKLAEQLLQVDTEAGICWRWLMAARVTGPLFCAGPGRSCR